MFDDDVPKVILFLFLPSQIRVRPLVKRVLEEEVRGWECIKEGRNDGLRRSREWGKFRQSTKNRMYKATFMWATNHILKWEMELYNLPFYLM